MLSRSIPSFARITLLGCGQIGGAVAQGILKTPGRHTLHIYDPNPKAAEINKTLVDKGAVFCNEPYDAVDSSTDVLISALPAPQHVIHAMESGPQPLLPRLRKGASWIDHTTTSPEEAARLGKKAADLGIKALEAPLTGGYALLQKQQMTCLVGGDKSILEGENEAIIRSYVKTVIHMGEEPGAASIVKVITNQLAAVHLVAAGEAVMMAKKSNINLKSFFDGVRASAGNSYVFETEVPLMYNQSFDPGFFIQLHCKDLGIARDVHSKALLESGNVSKGFDDVYRLNAESERIYEQTMRKYGESVGSSHPAKLIESWGMEDGAKNGSMKEEGFDEWTYNIDTVETGSIGVVHLNTYHTGGRASAART